MSAISCITGERFRARSILCEVRPPRAAVLVRSGRRAQGHGAADLQLQAAAHAYVPRELDGLLLDLLLDVRSGTARRVLEARGHPRSVLPERLPKSMM